jgi:hypothetical protein
MFEEAYISNLIKIRPMGAELLHAGGRLKSTNPRFYAWYSMAVEYGLVLCEKYGNSLENRKSKRMPENNSKVKQGQKKLHKV